MGHTHAEHSGRHPQLTIVLTMTATVLVVEVIGAVVSGSLALLADAGHMLTDVAGLSLALVASWLVGRPTSDAHTWGFRRAEVLAAAAQAAVLLAVGAYILIQAVRRLISAPDVSSAEMALFAIAALVGSCVSIGVLAGSRTHDMNMRAAFLEVVSDALGSVAVLVAAAVVALTGWTRADAVASLLIGALIVPRTWTLLRETVDVLLESTPRGLDLAEVRAHIVDVAHVRGIHDVHASQVATGLPVLTAHVVVDDGCFHDGHLAGLLDEIQNCLSGHFDVEHSTIQFEAASHADHEPAVHD